MKDCIFCRIVKGNVPSHKIYENKDFLAFLDIRPNTKGMTLVIPKKHKTSDVFLLNNKDFSNLMLASKKVANILSKKLGNIRVGMIFEGTEIDHAHIKLYPLHGLRRGKSYNIVDSKRPVFFEKYPNYMTSIHGPFMKEKELEKIKKIIKK